MIGKNIPSPFKENPHLLNIDAEYAVNLKILLESSPVKGYVLSKAALINSGKQFDCSSDIDSSPPSSPNHFANENITILQHDSNSCEKSPPVNDLKAIPEEISVSDSTFDHGNVISFEQDPIRSFHTNVFSTTKKENQPETVITYKTLPTSNPITRSKSLGKRNLSARIQSLLENFESNGQQSSSISSSPERRRSREKRLAKSGSPDNIFSDPKVRFCLDLLLL